jgi:chromosome segregation ATPase
MNQTILGSMKLFKKPAEGEKIMLHKNEIGLFNNKLRDQEYRIKVLAAKQEVVETVAAELANELRQAKRQRSQTAAQLRTLEAQQSRYYMWENIGCGG